MFSLVILYMFSFCILNIYGTREHEPFDIDSAPILFIDFMHKLGKKYESNLEMIQRFQIFKDNLVDVNKKNEEYPSAPFGITTFADWTTEEFMKLYACSFNDTNVKRVDFEVTVPVASELDWRQKGAVTAVKNQRDCASCWAFSTTGEVEGQYAIKNGNLVSLSEQELMDCSQSNGGCAKGGLPDKAMNDIAQIGGLMTEESYPYENRKNECRFKKDKAVVTLKGGSVLNVGESGLDGVLAQHGPVSVLLHASEEFQKFHGTTIFDPKVCSEQATLHAVLVVGYGPNYWIVKNSWGTGWGDNGYMKIIRGKNACAIGSYIVISQLG